MKWIDMPPVWLIAMLALAWLSTSLAPGLDFGLWANWAGPVLVVIGVGLMVMAVAEFNRAKTTIIPRNQPQSLITSGVYRISRNPIYLADTLILSGLILYWHAVLAVVLVPVFTWIIKTRFILEEEVRLAEVFPAHFEDYKSRTRRWI